MYLEDLPVAMTTIEVNGKRGSGNSVLAARHYNDILFADFTVKICTPSEEVRP